MNIPQVRGPVKVGPVNLPKGADTTYSPHEKSFLGQLLLQIPEFAKGVERIRQKKAQQSMIEELLASAGGSQSQTRNLLPEEGIRGIYPGDARDPSTPTQNRFSTSRSSSFPGADIRAQRERESQQPFLQRMLGGLFDPSRAPQSTPFETQAAEGILKSRFKGQEIGKTRAGINPATGEKITEVFTKEGWQRAKKGKTQTELYERDLQDAMKGLTSWDVVKRRYPRNMEEIEQAQAYSESIEGQEDKQPEQQRGAPKTMEENLRRLKAQQGKSTQDQYETGATYEMSDGTKRRYLGNGQWSEPIKVIMRKRPTR